jgi:uncharacterized protein
LSILAVASKSEEQAVMPRNLPKRASPTVCYDASHQGESGGQPHFLEDPSQRLSDVWSVDYLERLDFVDPNNIAVVGVCAGAGYATAVAKADYRLKPLLLYDQHGQYWEIRTSGWDSDESPTKHVETLKSTAQQIKAENNRAEPASAPYVPPHLDDKAPCGL